MIEAHSRDESHHDQLFSGISSRRLIFMFGQRTPGWDPGLVQRLFRSEPVFRETLIECGRTVSERLGWSLVD